MLTIKRKQNEEVWIGTGEDRVRVWPAKPSKHTQGRRVYLGVSAPDAVKVMRSEIIEQWKNKPPRNPQRGGGALILAREEGESLVIYTAGGEVRVTVLEVGTVSVRLGFEAPANVLIVRAEVAERGAE